MKCNSNKFLYFMLFKQILCYFGQFFPVFCHFKFKREYFFMRMLIEKFFNIHKSTTNSHHQHSIDDLCRYNLGSEKVFGLINSIDWYFNTILLYYIFKHPIYNIIVYAFVLYCIFERIVNWSLRLYFSIYFT